MRISPPLAVLVIAAAMVAVAAWLAPPQQGPAQSPPATAAKPKPAGG